MSQANQKRGHNKGIKAAAKLQRRIDAEERNTKTKPEDMAAYRRRLAGDK